MNKPLNDVPLNTKKVYVRGLTNDGCEIYMPVDSHDDKVIDQVKEDLQKQLDCQLVSVEPDYPSVA